MTLLHLAKSFVARRLLAAGLFAVLASLAGASAGASVIDLGYVSYDVTSAGATAEFDITNLTGANSTALGSPDFPVTTAVSLSGLSLTIDFSDGSSETLGASKFTLSADGLSWDGSTIGIGGLNPSPTKAVLTGTFDTTSLTLAGGSTTTIDASFMATLLPSSPPDLGDGDFALIVGTVSTGPPPVPEPDSFGLALAGAALLGVALILRRRPHAAGPAAAVAVALTLGLGAAPASAAVTLSTAASPSSGAAGITTVNLTANGLPTGLSASQITVTLAPTCAAGATGPVTGELTTTASSLQAILSLSRIGFQIPAAALNQTYFASISGTGFASTGCAIIKVSHTTTGLSACVPTSSLAIATGTKVIAYVPKGAWSAGTTGIEAVEIEGPSVGPLTTIATTETVNSCAANPATSETVCSGNEMGVYVINGATQTLSATLTSGATGTASFSGGSCENCGVAINALTNTAYITEGDPSSSSRDAIQTLNLLTNTFGPVVPTTVRVSEDISVDPSRNLLLSPDESENYDVFQLSGSTGALLHEFGNQFSFASQGDGEFDSAAEDCSTGIALSSLEFTSNVFMTDLSQAKFTPAVPPATAGTWTAPNQTTTLAGTFSAGTDGISVASGSSHLGVVTGEFGGANLAVLQLPATSGTGTPALVDYAVANLPATPDKFNFSMGYDPHTITAYTSPNNGKAYAVIADWARGTPSYLAVIDLHALITATRTTGTHNVDPSVDLLGTGIVRYVATH